MKLYYNPHCSKCREGLQILTEEGFKPELVEYLKSKPSEAEIFNLLNLLDTEPASLVRVKDSLYTENPFPLDDKMKIAKALALKPELMERPVFVYKNKAIVARPPELIKKLLPSSVK